MDQRGAQRGSTWEYIKASARMIEQAVRVINIHQEEVLCSGTASWEQLLEREGAVTSIS